MSEIINPYPADTEAARLYEHYAQAWLKYDRVYQPAARLRDDRANAFRPRMGHRRGQGWSNEKAAELERLEGESAELQKDVNAYADRLIASTGRPVPIVRLVQ